MAAEVIPLERYTWVPALQAGGPGLQRESDVQELILWVENHSKNAGLPSCLNDHNMDINEYMSYIYVHMYMYCVCVCMHREISGWYDLSLGKIWGD